MRALRLLYALPVALLAACGRAPRDAATSDGASSTGAADSARLLTARSTAPSAAARSADTAGAAVAPAAAGESPLPSAALCAEVAAVAGRALRIPFTRDSGSTFPAPVGSRPPWRGCLLRGSGSVRPFSTAPLPEYELTEAMKREGWTEDITFDAAGPEGSSFAMRRGETLCHYDIFFPGTPGDDEESAADTVVAVPDTTRPPLPYVVKILCTQGPESTKRPGE